MNLPERVRDLSTRVELLLRTLPSPGAPAVGVIRLALQTQFEALAVLVQLGQMSASVREALLRKDIDGIIAQLEQTQQVMSEHVGYISQHLATLEAALAQALVDDTDTE